MQDCKPQWMPCETDIKIVDKSNVKPTDKKYYWEIVGNLIYVMTATHLYICYIATKLLQYSAKPTMYQLIRAKQVLHYLKGTKHIV